MNKEKAGQIAEKKLQEILCRKEPDLIKLLDKSEYELRTKDGVEYQIRANAFYDDKDEKIIRVLVSVDDQGFWSTFMPLTVSDLLTLKSGRMGD